MDVVESNIIPIKLNKFHSFRRKCLLKCLKIVIFIIDTDCDASYQPLTIACNIACYSNKQRSK